MDQEKALVTFEKHAIRRYYDESKEVWYFSVVDVVAALTESANPAVYWRVLKKRLKDEGADETVTKCNALKMPSADGKMRLTDMADTETLLRLIQSIPSPKAEPFKQWLAKVGYERIQDMSDPARSLDRAREYWQAHGRSEKWIQQRMMGQETRNKLTDYWKDHEIKGEDEYAILTNIIHQEWSGVSVKKHKAIKGLKTQNLRDHMQRGGADLHRAGGTLDPADRRERTGDRYAGERGGGQKRGQDRKEGSVRTGTEDGQKCGDGREFPSAVQGPKKDQGYGR